MLSNIVVLLVIAAIAAGLFWLALKMFRMRSPVAKWGGTVGLGLVGVLVSVFAILVAMGAWTLYAPRGNEVRDVTVAGTPDQIARGEEIVRSVCAGCHGEPPGYEPPLTGGPNLLADIPMPIGSATPPNLTPAGRIDEWTDGELQRAIREGTYPNGHLMPIMSSQTFRYFSQEDLDSIVAFLRSQPATEGSYEPDHQLTVLALAFATLGMLPLKDAPDSNVPPPAVAKGPTVEYGRYIVQYTDCALCHGETFEGGAGGLLPAGPSLRPAAQWTTSQFIQTLRTGVNPDGNELDPNEMPWEEFGRLDDESLTAIHSYLKGM